MSYEESNNIVNSYYTHLDHDKYNDDCDYCDSNDATKLSMYSSFLEASKRVMLHHCIFYDCGCKVLTMYLRGEYKTSKYDNYNFEKQCKRIEYLASKRVGHDSLNNIIVGIAHIIEEEQYYGEIFLIMEYSLKNNNYELFLSECSKLKNIHYCYDYVFKLTFEALVKYNLDYEEWSKFIEYVVQLSTLYRLIRTDDLITDFEIVEFVNIKSVRRH